MNSTTTTIDITDITEFGELGYGDGVYVIATTRRGSVQIEFNRESTNKMAEHLPELFQDFADHEDS